MGDLMEKLRASLKTPFEKNQIGAAAARKHSESVLSHYEGC